MKTDICGEIYQLAGGQVTVDIQIGHVHPGLVPVAGVPSLHQGQGTSIQFSQLSLVEVKRGSHLIGREIQSVAGANHLMP